MKQVLIIHGGNSFSSYDAYKAYLNEKQLSYEKLIHPIRWKEHLAYDLSDYDVIYPSMPNPTNAVYDEWKIYFEKIVPFFGNDVQIVGHSLGAMFLAKYLNGNPLPKPVNKLLLVSGGYDNDIYEDLGSFKVDSASSLPRSAKEIHLFHSKDDPVVPFTELAKFQVDIPNATSHVFTNRGHFTDETFPEIIETLKQK